MEYKSFQLKINLHEIISSARADVLQTNGFASWGA